VNWDITFLETLTLAKLTFAGDNFIQSGMSLLFERVKHLFLFVMMLTLLEWLKKLQVFIITSAKQTQDAAVRLDTIGIDILIHLINFAVSTCIEKPNPTVADITPSVT
jgi:hypothetical protein